MNAVNNYRVGEGNLTDAIEQTVAIAKAIDGRRHNRTLSLNDVTRLFDTIEQYPDAKQIRKYSSRGFVPNAYKRRAAITYAWATKNDDGSWNIGVSVCHAKRSYSRGALLTVDGRGK